MDIVTAAAGLRGVPIDGGRYGLTLVVRMDLLIVRTTSDAASGTGGKGERGA